MMNPVQINLQQADGGTRLVIIQPIIQRGGERGLSSTGVYRTFNNPGDAETHLLSEVVYLSDIINDPSDDLGPDYLGKFQFDGNSWEYKGGLLNSDEQSQITKTISSYSDLDY